MTGEKMHFREIDALKGFAIFLVVLGHAIILHPVNLHDNAYCYAVIRFLSSVHMPLFFLISGFCFSYKNNYKDFMLKKVNRILIPYFAFNILDMLPRQLLPQLVNRSQSFSKSILDTFFYGGEYWFLYVLFIIFAIYPFIYKWQNESPKRKAFLMIVLILLSIPQHDIDFFRLSQTVYYLLFFNAGVLIKTSGIKLFDFEKTAMKWLTPFCLLFVWIIALFLGLETILPVTIAMLGIVCCYYFTRFDIFNRIFKRFGEYSLQLYLFNGYFLVISRTIICKFTDIPVLIVGFNMLIDFGLSYLLIKYVCRRVGFLRKIMGMN